MDLFEYQGKQYFARFGITISKGGVADTVDQAVAQAEESGYPVVVKAQVKVGGRGKAGGVKLAADAGLVGYAVDLDHDRVTGLVGLGYGLIDGVGDASGGHRDAVVGEVLLALVFEEIHRIRSSLPAWLVGEATG